MRVRRPDWNKVLVVASILSVASMPVGCDQAKNGNVSNTISARASSAPTSAPAPEAKQASSGQATPGRMMQATPGKMITSEVDRSMPVSAPKSEAPPAPQWANRQASAPSASEEANYSPIVENNYKDPKADPLSTFSIDVDTASYSNVRRFLTQGMLPPNGAIRIEEMVNYFPYAYPQPSTKGNDPFSINVEVAACPWDENHRLARIGLKGREIAFDKRPSSNLVFLIDVSGSMADQNKLPLVKQSLRMLVSKLGENDRVAMVVYASATGLVLPSTSCENKSTILAAIDNLEAGGSTNGSAGIQLAYETAVSHFIPGGTNRVILCTDGDWNVGITSQEELIKLITAKAKTKVFLSVLGFGMGNYKDKTIEHLADKGNGNSAYIDSLKEAAKVLVEQMGGTLVTIAKDVKIQVEFNPAKVASYRLIGYEDRLLKARDFNDDKKDAGEIGAGLTVTALYEIVPAGREADAPGVDPLKYQKSAKPPTSEASELFTVKLRFKPPQGDESQLISFAVEDDGIDDSPTDDFRFASAVVEFGLLLRNSPNKGKASWESVLERAESSQGKDASGYRREFVELVKKARTLASASKN
jgi:Ca-activated chloride channel family protein